MELKGSGQLECRKYLFYYKEPSPRHHEMTTCASAQPQPCTGSGRHMDVPASGICLDFGAEKHFSFMPAAAVDSSSVGDSCVRARPGTSLDLHAFGPCAPLMPWLHSSHPPSLSCLDALLIPISYPSQRYCDFFHFVVRGPRTC